VCDEINISLIGAELIITDFKEGNIAILKIKRDLSNYEFDQIDLHLKEKYPEIQFMIIDDGIDIEVSRKETE